MQKPQNNMFNFEQNKNNKKIQQCNKDSKG